MASRIAALTEYVQAIAAKLAARSSLKKALSAGIVLLDKVPAELRELATEVAEGRDVERFDKRFEEIMKEVIDERIQSHLPAHKDTLVDVVNRAEDEEVAAMLDAIGEMIEKDGGQRILGPKASIGADRLRDILVKSFKRNAKKQLP